MASRRPWSCSSCMAALFLAIFSVGANAAEVRRRDGLHRLAKAHVTAFHDLQRRDEITACPTSHTLCPSSLNGGCCMDGYECATNSCFVTTKAPQTCQGRVGYYACPPELEGGCCPEGYICRRGGNCVVPDGASYSQSCPTNYFLCPSSLNYGCCRDGMGCAASACYSTEPSTYTVTRTVTTTASSGSEDITTTITATTISTPSAPTAYPTADGTGDGAQVVVKFYPSALAKVDPEITESEDKDDDDDGGGGTLTTGQIAGVVVGAVVLLVIVLVAAFFIMRRLNKVVRAVESQKASSSNNSNATKQPQMAQHYRPDKPTPSEIDDMSIDPLIMTPSSRVSRARSDSELAASGFDSPELGSPPLAMMQSPIGPGGGYQAVPTSNLDRNAGQVQGSAAAAAAAAGSSGMNYFDIAVNRPQRASHHSGHSYTHVRHWSNASDGSAGDAASIGSYTPQELEGTKPLVSELPAGGGSPPETPDEEGRRRSSSSMVSALSSATTTVVGRPPLTYSRRRSNEGRGRSDSAATATAQQPTLSVVAEDTELMGSQGMGNRATGYTTSTTTATGNQNTEQHTDPSQAGSALGDWTSWTWDGRQNF